MPEPPGCPQHAEALPCLRPAVRWRGRCGGVGTMGRCFHGREGRRGGGGSCQAPGQGLPPCQHPVTHSPGGRLLDCVKFKAQGGRGRGQSPGSDPAVPPLSSGVTVGLGTPVCRAGANALCRGWRISSSSNAHSPGAPFSSPLHARPPSAWAKPSGAGGSQTPACRMSACEHGACRALAPRQEGPSCGAIPPCCQGAPWSPAAAWGPLPRPALCRLSPLAAGPTPVPPASSCVPGCAHAAAAAAPALCLAAGRDQLPPWRLPIKPISWMAPVMQESEAL